MVRRQLNALAEHGQRPGTATDAVELLGQAVEVVMELLDADVAVAMSISAGTATVVAGRGAGDAFPVGWTCPVEHLGAREAVSSRAAVSGEDIRTVSRHPGAAQWEVQSYCAAPVLVDGEVVGLLCALRRDRRRGEKQFGPEDTSVLSLLAGQTSAAVQRGHTVNGFEQRRQKAEAMRDIVRGLGSSLQAEAVLRRFSASLLATTGGCRASVLLLDEDGLYLRLASRVTVGDRAGHPGGGAGGDAGGDADGDTDRPSLMDDRDSARATQTPLATTGPIRTAIEQRTVVRCDVGREPGDRDAFGAVYRPSRHAVRILLHPLQVNEQVLGVLAIEQNAGSLPFDDEVLDVVDQIATVGAVSLQHAELYEGMQRGRAQLRALHDVTLAIGATNDLSATLDAITSAALRLTGATRCRLGLQETAHTYVIAAMTGDSDEVGAVYSNDLGVGGWIIDHGQAVWMPDLAQGVCDPPEAAQALARRPEGSAVAVALRGRTGAAIGFLSLHHPAPGHFRHEVTTLLDRFAAEAVLAVDNDSDSRARRTLEERLREQAHHDPLTGLGNRTLLLEQLDAALRRSRDVGSVGVLYLDLDRFKTVNDSLGHTGGDELLVGVAERLLAVVRPADLVARLGGDEFVVLVTDGAEPKVMADLAERVRSALAEPMRVAGAPVFVSASIGVVNARGTRRDSGQILRDADVAMYQAKAAGKNRYAVFNGQMRTRAVGRLPIETELREALDAGQLQVHYQPIVSLVDGQVTGLEALVRWPHPQRGLVPPDTFIPIAEETGLVARIDAEVLGAAAKQVRQWQLHHNRPDLELSVNLSAVSLGEHRLSERIAAALADAELPGSSLVVELTETAAMRNPQQSLGVFRQLRSLGMKVAIDDFGTGYSNLGYLRRFPVDCLKIDREFIRLLGEEDSGEPIVRAMLALAAALGLRVTAEGVETAAQATWLQEQSCSHAQGYHFGKPLDVAGTDALLGRSRQLAQK